MYIWHHNFFVNYWWAYVDKKSNKITTYGPSVVPGKYNSRKLKIPSNDSNPPRKWKQRLISTTQHESILCMRFLSRRHKILILANLVFYIFFILSCTDACHHITGAILCSYSTLLPDRVINYKVLIDTFNHVLSRQVDSYIHPGVLPDWPT